jgi:hypothetical protein
MKAIYARYGESVVISVNDTDEAVTATLYVGMEGESPVITKTAAFSAGTADLSLDPEDTEIPLDSYKYQINVEYSDGTLLKYPKPTSCDGNDLPDFIIVEALDETETS